MDSRACRNTIPLAAPSQFCQACAHVLEHASTIPTAPDNIAELVRILRQVEELFEARVIRVRDVLEIVGCVQNAEALVRIVPGVEPGQSGSREISTRQGAIWL